MLMGGVVVVVEAVVIVVLGMVDRGGYNETM